MSDVSISRHEIGVLAVRFFPPIIQESLLASRAFRMAYNIKTDAQIVLGHHEITFKRSKFYDAIRRTYSAPVETVELRSDQGDVYAVTLEEGEDDKDVVLRRGEKIIRLPPHWYLSPNTEDRLRRLESSLRRSNIDEKDAAIWKDRLAAGPAKDDEVEELCEYLTLTPLAVARAIGREVRTGTSKVSTLVPTKALYYERLIGSLDNSNDLESFATGALKRHIARLLNCDFSAGLMQALHISPHSSLSTSIPIEGDRGEELVGAYQRLATDGDRFSQVAAVELGFGLLKRFPTLEASILKIAKAILDDRSDDEQGRLKLTASLVIFVDGELARLGVFRDAPPFWRRLAAIAQASLIEQQLSEVGIERGQFSDWAIEARGQIFFLQSLVDLRLEPRWLPDFINPDQLRLEFLGRIYGAGMRFQSAIRLDELRELVSGSGPTSLQATMKSPMAYLPGPLEGGSVSPIPFPEDLALKLREPESKEPLSESALAGVVNMALIFRIEGEHARVVTDALRRTKHQLSVEADSVKIFTLLSGLAMVAAVTRAPELANEVRILARVQRRRPGVTLDPNELMRIGFMAAASQTELDKWCASVGEWLSEISYEKIDRKSASAMQAQICQLCELVPPLWRTCAEAEAAFAAVAGMAA